MTPQDIEKIAAAENAQLPDGLPIRDQLLFFTLRELYKNYRSGAVNRERATKEKSKVYDAYDAMKRDFDLAYQYLQMRRRVGKEIGNLHKCGCETCQKVARILDGIDRTDIPDDIRELHEWNEKLRALVKERSERNASLGTKLTMIQFALESSASPEEKLKKIAEYVKE